MPNRIEQEMIKVGIPMPAFRLAMRNAAAQMIVDGPGTTAGVHDVGVFYVQSFAERFICYDGAVWKVDARDVLKLRPSKGTTTELNESADVTLSVKHVYTADLDYEFSSASKAAQFNLDLPSARAGETWKLTRIGTGPNGVYVFAHDNQNPATIASNGVPVFNASDEWEGGVLEFSLTSWAEAVDANGFSLSQPRLEAELDGGGMAGPGDVVGGAEALAHIRCRAVT